MAVFDQTTTITLGYWKIRGLAQSCRVLMHYSDMEFENKMFPQDPCPRPIPEKLCPGHPFPDMKTYDDSKKCWFDVKFSVMGDYHSPNLPFLLDGDVKLTESNAILRYLGRKAASKGGNLSTLMGGTPQEVANNEFMIDKAMDLRNKVIALGYGTFWPSATGQIEKLAGQDATEYWNKTAGEYKEAMKGESGPTSLVMFEKYMGDGPYFAGANVTVCDFHMYELLDQQRDMLGASVYEGFPKIQKFLELFGSQPKVQEAYVKYKLPANNEMSWTTVTLGC